MASVAALRGRRPAGSGGNPPGCGPNPPQTAQLDIDIALEGIDASWEMARQAERQVRVSFWSALLSAGAFVAVAVSVIVSASVEFQKYYAEWQMVKTQEDDALRHTALDIELIEIYLKPFGPLDIEACRVRAHPTPFEVFQLDQLEQRLTADAHEPYSGPEGIAARTLTGQIRQLASAVENIREVEDKQADVLEYPDLTHRGYCAGAFNVLRTNLRLAKEQGKEIYAHYLKPLPVPGLIFLSFPHSAPEREVLIEQDGPRDIAAIFSQP